MGVTVACGTIGAMIGVSIKMHRIRVIFGTPRAPNAGMIMNTPPTRDATRPMVTRRAVLTRI